MLHPIIFGHLVFITVIYYCRVKLHIRAQKHDYSKVNNQIYYFYEEEDCG